MFFSQVDHVWFEFCTFFLICVTLIWKFEKHMKDKNESTSEEKRNFKKYLSTTNGMSVRINTKCCPRKVAFMPIFIKIKIPFIQTPQPS